MPKSSICFIEDWQCIVEIKKIPGSRKFVRHFPWQTWPWQTCSWKIHENPENPYTWGSGHHLGFSEAMKTSVVCGIPEDHPNPRSWV